MTIESTSFSAYRPTSSLRDVRPGEIIGFAQAHPDDELLAGALIRRLQRAGAHIVPIIASNGEASDRGSPDFLAEGGRLQEGAAAWQSYGVPKERIVYLNLPDGHLHEDSNRTLLERRTLHTIATLGISTLVTLGEEGVDGHTDHIAMHHASVAAAGILAAGLRRKPIDVVGLSLTGEADEIVPVSLDDKLSVLKHHNSQFRIEAAPSDDTPPADGWVRMGTYNVHSDSATLLERYTELLTQHELYKVYKPSSGY